MDAFNIILKKVKKGQHRFTLNDAVVFSGLSIDDVRNALDLMIERYTCRLQLTENADLIYNFGAKLRRRNNKSFKELWESILKTAWKSFTIIFKVWLTITLVVYFTLFVILLIALLISSQSSKRGGRSQGPQFGRLVYIFSSIFRWQTHSGTILQGRDRQGYPYSKYKPSESILKPQKKNLIASVYDFVFGPSRVESDPDHDQREIAAFLRKKKGIIVRTDIEALTGRNSPHAEHLFTECLIRFNGTVHVNDNGVIYGRFDNLLRSSGNVETEEVIYYWDEYEPEYELTGNSGARNGFIFFMNGVNLFISYLILSGSLYTAASTTEAAPFLYLILDLPLLFGWVPFIFSALFYIIPLVRWLRNHQLSKKRRKNNIRKRIFRVIYQNTLNSYATDYILRAINSAASEENLSADIIKRMMDELVLDQDGELIISDNASIEYTFPQINLEQSEVEHIRSSSRPETSLGQIILDAD